MSGVIHSFESLAAVDGEGLRYAVFLSGCPLRCVYCHNPDTWKMNTGSVRSAQSLIQDYERNKAFYARGGITVTGGEALMQIDFLLELFTLAKQKNIHTCLDTSGITYHPGESSYNEKLDELMKVTDLVMLDIKHIDPEGHKALTGHDNAGILAFAKYLEEKNIPVWIRHVVVPGITDDESLLSRLGTFLGTLSNIQALDVLPYHIMGVSKYEQLGISYPLEGVPPATKDQAAKAKKIILTAYWKQRRKCSKTEA